MIQSLNYSCKIWGHTIFTVFVPFLFSGNNTLTQDSDVHWERATYNCPWEKTGVCKSNPTFATDCPWDLLMIIAKASWTGNWWCMNFTGISSAEGVMILFLLLYYLVISLTSFPIFPYFSYWNRLLLSNTDNHAYQPYFSLFYNLLSAYINNPTSFYKYWLNSCTILSLFLSCNNNKDNS